MQAFANGHQRTTLPAQAPAGEGRAAGPPVVRRWLPFSMGTRDCIGQSLARMNYLTTVAMLIARFEFRLHDRVSAPGMPFNLSQPLRLKDLSADQHDHEPAIFGMSKAVRFLSSSCSDRSATVEKKGCPSSHQESAFFFKTQ